MFIDIHAHAYLYPSPPQDGRTQFCSPEELLRRYDELGIEKGVLLPLVGPEIYMPQSNQEILEICRRYPDRFVPFCNIDPRGIRNSASADFSPWLDWYKEHGFLGVGEFMPNLSFLDPLVQNFFKQVDAMNWPLTFDVAVKIGNHYGLVDVPGMSRLEYCLKTFPNMTILGHGPAFWSEMGTLRKLEDRGTYPPYPIDEEGAVPRLMRLYDNLWGDLSAGSGFNALARDKKHAIKFIHEFQDKLCFGTDICTADGPAPLAGFLIELKDEGHISEEIFQKIAKKNTIRLLNLKEG